MIDLRNEESGFIYVGKTRVGFSPIRTIRRDFPQAEALVIWAVQRWPEPTLADIGRCIDQLSKRFPGRAIFADSEEGPVPMNEAAR